MAKPLVIDLFCGLGGWSRAFLDEGWEAIGVDTERHDYGTGGYPGQLVLQDVLTLDGRQFRGRAALIVASPPCQEFSYMAMPWSRGRQIAAALRGEADFPENYKGSRTVEELCALFNACFRIAGESGIPLVVENVKGAQPWVGQARANFGSFFFWGDIEQVGNRIMRSGPVQFGQATVVAPGRGLKNGGNRSWFNIGGSPGQTETGNNPDGRKMGQCNGKRFDERPASVALHNEGSKVPGFRFDGSGKSFQSASVEGTKCPRYDTFSKTGVPCKKLTDPRYGIKGFAKRFEDTPMAAASSASNARKAASATIAMIPYPLAQHMARVFKP